MARLGDPNPDARIGSYYRLKGNMNSFYFNIPGFTDVLPNRYLMRRHVVQLLDDSAGNGWARVKNEDLQIGYVKFENIRIVPWTKQPKPKSRDAEADLDQSMRVEEHRFTRGPNPVKRSHAIVPPHSASSVAVISEAP